MTNYNLTYCGKKTSFTYYDILEYLHMHLDIPIRPWTIDLDTNVVGFETPAFVYIILYS